MTGCGMYMFLMLWGMGLFCTLGSFVVKPRDQGPFFFKIGLAFLIPAILWTRSMILAPKREAEAKRKAKLAEQTKEAQEQQQLSELEGLAKYHRMDENAARRYQEGVAAIHQLGILMQQSVYQEQEKDWALLGGVAEGIAGPVAGVLTAVDAMQDNEKIRAQNAARREWGARQNAFYQDLARQAHRERPVALSMEELREKYEAVLSWDPDTLFSLLRLTDVQAEVDEITGAVTVSAHWQQKDNSICIDGTLRAKLYTAAGVCVGCAYLVLPMTGTVGFKGYLEGICVEPKEPGPYTVILEPVDLWELAAKGNAASRKTGVLSVSKHRKIVAQIKTRYQNEIGE